LCTRGIQDALNSAGADHQDGGILQFAVHRCKEQEVQRSGAAVETVLSRCAATGIPTRLLVALLFSGNGIASLNKQNRDANPVF
jgi:hypothetical protein